MTIRHTAVWSAASGIAVAVAAQAMGATTRIEGYEHIFQVAADAAGSVAVSDWNGIPGRPDVAYPELELREYFPHTGAFDQRVFLRIDLSSIPAGSIVTDARFNLFWFDTYDTGAHSDWVDLWSVADRVEGGANFNTSNGSSPWTDGFQAGIDGYARTGPAGTHLGFIWHSAAAPAGTPSANVMNLVQEYKEFVSDGGQLEAYLTTQINGSGEANFALSIGNDSGLWQRFIAASDDGTFWPAATENPAFGNQPYLDINYLPAGSGIWNQDNDGVWSLSDNWQHNVPNSPGAEALFGGVITSDHSVLVDVPHIVGGIIFNNAHRYSVGGATITLDTVNGPASVSVMQGHHEISAPLQLNKPTAFAIAGGSTLTVASDMASAGIGITKTGAGALRVTNVRAAALTVDEGLVAIAPNGTAAGRSTVQSLNIAGGASPSSTLDISNNAFVVDYTGGSPLPTIRAQIVSAYGGGSWDGPGITSSVADATSHGIGYAESAALGSIPSIFGSVDATAVLIRSTRYGDSNLDGLVNLQDFNALAANFGSTDALWHQGDFNYDGIVNLSDFNRLAANFGLQASAGGPTPDDWAALAAAVPEPAALSAWLVGAGVLLARRKRG